MTQYKLKLDVSRRARAVVRAQRWAHKHAPKARPNRRPWIVAFAAIGVGLLSGGLLSIGLQEQAGTDRPSWLAWLLNEPDAPAAGQGGAWVVAQQPVPPDMIQLQQLIIENVPDDESAIRPYEEPLIPDETLQWRAPPGLPETDSPAVLFGLDRSGGEPAPWRRHAVAVADPQGKPMIALVIDDVGIRRANAWRAIDLPPPLTLSFLSYAEGLEEMTKRAHDAGHELLLHMPMEPSDPQWDPGPNALLTDLSQAELKRRMDWAFGRFEGYVGINNHMGSRFTASLLGMAQVMAELKSRGLLFLDSITTGSSVGVSLARRVGVPHAGRDIFIDNNPDRAAAIHRQLGKLEATARLHGQAIGIAHPHDLTLQVLAEWLPDAQRRGFVLVPLTAVVERHMAAAQESSLN